MISKNSMTCMIMTLLGMFASTVFKTVPFSSIWWASISFLSTFKKEKPPVFSLANGTIAVLLENINVPSIGTLMFSVCEYVILETKKKSSSK